VLFSKRPLEAFLWSSSGINWMDMLEGVVTLLAAGAQWRPPSPSAFEKNSLCF
jgi:hypothetical protein